MDKNVILFGAGVAGQEYLKRIGKDIVAFFVDNNPGIVGKSIDGISILSVSELKRLYNIENYEIVVTNVRYFDEIKNQLEEMGISNCQRPSQFLVTHKFKNSHKRRIILANTHMGTNVGDHLITLAELLFFKRYLPETEVIELTADVIEEYFDLVKKYIVPTDIIAISGGGYMGSLWLVYGEYNVRRIVSELPENRIIVLPQSIHFEDNLEGKEQLSISQEIYNKHKNLTVCLREPRQVCNIKKIFDKTIMLLEYPDMVLSMDCLYYSIPRNKVGICFRTDKESNVGESDKDTILNSIDDNIIYFDMHTKYPVIGEERNLIIENYISLVSECKYVITDRLHCMLLCLITGTPCIAFDNLTGKLTSVHEWIDDAKYLNIVRTAEEAQYYIEIYSSNTDSKWCNWKTAYEKFQELAALFEV